MARVFLVDTAACSVALEQLEAAEPRLPPDEVGRGDTIRDPDRRQTWRATYVALRVILENRAGPLVRGRTISRTPAGRPFLAGAPDFSLSHTDGLSAIVVSETGPVGIDVEIRRAVRLSPEREQRLIAAATQMAGLAADDVLIAWTRLEALAKARGDGIGAVLAEIGRDPAGPSQSSGWQALAADAGLRVEDLSLQPGFVGAVAVPRSIGGVGVFKLPTDVDSLRQFASGRDAVDLHELSGQKSAVRSVAQPG